jgi:hypothetical protein
VSVSRIAEQLRATKALFGYAYAASHPELENWLTDTLARRIADYGLTDVRQIGYGPQGFFNRDTGATLERGLHFYDFSGGTGVHDNASEPVLWPWVRLDVFDIATNDDWFAMFFVRFTADGVPYFIATLKEQQSIGEAFAELAGMAFAAASFFVPGVNAAIAGAIFSPATIAAYPALTTITTNTIVQTALNGGDVERAVQLSVAAYVGANVGGFVAGVSDSKALGTLSSAATRAALTGGDVEKAVVSAVVSLAPDALRGVDVAGPALSPVADPDKLAIETPGPMMNDYDYGYGYSTGDAFTLTPEGVAPELSAFNVSNDAVSLFDLNSSEVTPAFSLDDSLIMGAYDYAPLDDLPAYQYTIPTGGPVIDVPAVVVEAANVETPAAAAPLAPAASSVDFGTIVKNVTFAAQSALALTQAWNAAKNPTINATARTTTQGKTVSASDSGLIQTTTQSGQVVAQKPAVGQPQMTTTGNLIVNNGDNTYTLIAPDGSRRVIAYPQTSIPTISGGFSLASLGLSSEHVAYAVGAVGLLFALSRRK